MARCLGSRSRLGPRRPLLFQLLLSQPFLRHASANAKWGNPLSHSKPTPSQLLRFALTGTTQPARHESFTSHMDQHLRELFSEQWPSDNPPPLPPWSSLQQRTTGSHKKAVLKALKGSTKSLQHLRLLIENNVNDGQGGALLQTERCRFLAQTLERCQRHDSYGEILSTINVIITRLGRLGVPISHSLFTLGMYYSCLAFSASALKWHLKGYLSLGPERLDPESSAPLVEALNISLRLLSFQEPGYNTSEMLNIVTGESTDGDFSEHNLHSIMPWANHEDSPLPVGQYLSLLARLRSKQVLQEVWDRTLKGLGPDSPPHVFQSAYDCVEALIEVGNSSKATAHLEEISKCANGSLPGLSKFRGLRSVLAAEGMAQVLPQLAGKEYLSILETQLGNMEKRLGITWDRQKSVHTSISNPPCISSKQPLLTVDGDSTGYGSSVRLIAEIQALGCSKSMLELGKIVDLLDEYGGDQVHVSLSSKEAAHYDFSWFPERSPIAFSNSLSLEETDKPKPWSPSSLGLLRVRPHNDGIHLAVERSLHLMQLGYLVVRPKLTHQVDLGETQRWEETGHIVTWDRVFGRFVSIFVGKSCGDLEPDKPWIVADPSLGLDAVMTISPGNDLLDQIDMNPPFGNSGRGYCVDVDPGPDLDL
ncbi:hypothetical protein BDV28DRAFT_140756 [Aspergillus coremiiformis]|uniref:Uncharacterized protein n=1 Tax=Aspergillus coremiiformis TaxID=138285 RepID=A0A5N6YW43_9EURO|nr:hypothetical protein BDV28DRAFT_140756 [Aspergillus coremiiformis]